MSRNITFISWIALLIAIVAWVGVGFFAVTIQAAAASDSLHMKELSSSSIQTSRISSLQKLVSETADDRATLNTIALVNPASLADTITNAGSSAGVAIDISDANSANGPSINGAPAAHAFSFIASATGSFASVMYAMTLLQSLPVPSSIQQIQLISAPTTAGAAAVKPSWQMDAQINVVTASDISS